jgi:hypothetical protein
MHKADGWRCLNDRPSGYVPIAARKSGGNTALRPDEADRPAIGISNGFSSRHIMFGCGTSRDHVGLASGLSARVRSWCVQRGESLRGASFARH